MGFGERYKVKVLQDLQEVLLQLVIGMVKKNSRLTKEKVVRYDMTLCLNYIIYSSRYQRVLQKW